MRGGAVGGGGGGGVVVDCHCEWVRCEWDLLSVWQAS